MSDSSDPSTTDYEITEDQNESTVPGLTESEEYSDSLNFFEAPAGTSISEMKNFLPVVLIIFIDIIIPLMLILSAISCMSIMGMIFILLLYLHVVIANKVEKSFSALRTCLSVDFVINLIVFIFAIVNYFVDLKDNKVVSYIGLNFNNIITSVPTFTLVSSLLALICQLSSLTLLSKTSVKRFVRLRVRYFNSVTFQFGLQVFWAIFNAFNAASNFSYLYLPILVYFIISNICQSINGKIGLSKFLFWVLLFYSLLFALFELFIVSYVGEELDKKYNISEKIKYVYIAPDSTKALNVVVAVLFAYISIQQISAPGLKVGEQKQIPGIVKQMNDVLLVISFGLTMLYACFYPNYISVIWMIIPFLSTFTSMDKIRRFFLPLLTVIFTIPFVIIFLTSVYLFDEPKNNGKDNKLGFLYLFGLYRYKGDFTYSCCGFYINCILGIMGAITNAQEKPAEEKKEEEEVKEEKIENTPELVTLTKKKTNGNDFDNLFEEEEEEPVVVSTEPESEKIKFNFSFKKLFEKIKALWIKLCGVIYLIYAYIIIAAIVMIGIICGHLKDRIAFQVLAAIFIVIVLCALYKKIIFEFIKLITGLMIMFATFYKTSINETCINHLDECLFYGKWNDDINEMVKTGLIAPYDMKLIEFIWPLIAIFILSIILTKDKKILEVHLPPAVRSAIFSLVAVFHFLYMYLFDTNIFSIIFMCVGLIIIISQYLGKNKLIALSSFLSCISISFQLGLTLLTHFEGPRNFLGSVVPEEIINLKKVYEPSLEIVFLAIILFLSTISFYSKNNSKSTNLIIDNILYEIRVILDLFYFYISWIFIFLFSIVNDNPSFIKFILMLFFALGRWSSPIFYKIRIPFLMFNIAYAIVQYIFHIFGFDDMESKNYGIYSYLGFFFCSPGKPTKKQRNMSLMYQFIVMIIGIINIKQYERRVADREFEALLGTRIYNAIAAMLHHWLSFFIQVSLCVSAVFNPSIFGWLSYVVMIIVVFKPSILNTSSGLVTLLFNICFIAQYLLYLGFPTAIFNKSFSVISHIKTTNQERKDDIINWLKWAGVYNVKTIALATNCISAFIFTFYMTWHNTFVNYELRYEALPDVMKFFIKNIVIHIYEITTAIILILTIYMKTIDGLLSFLLTGVLVVCSIFYEYPKAKSLLIMSISSICVIGLRLLSRLPIFTQEGNGKWIKKVFDLPFQGDSSSEIMVILCYSFERLCIHILQSDIYRESQEEFTKRLAYRYVRQRQLSLIEKYDKINIENKSEVETKQIRSMATNNINAFSESLGKSENMLILKSEVVNNQISQTAKHWYSYIPRIISYFVDEFIKIASSSLPVNCEAGLNFLTLKSFAQIMKRVTRFYKTGVAFIPTLEEKGFMNSLPPSFHYHFHSLAEANEYHFYDSSKIFNVYVHYVLFLIRKISTPLLALAILIYVYLKPYLFGLLVILLFIGIILPIDMKGKPKVYITFFSLVLLILSLQCICRVRIIADEINEKLNSVKFQQKSIDVITLLGVNPNQSAVPDILLFLATVFFICDKLSQVNFYSPFYYYQKFKSILPGFPTEYCYGILKDPVNSLEMEEDEKSIFKVIHNSFSKPGLIQYYHHIWLLVVDVISFIILFFTWSKWCVKDTENKIIGSGSNTIQIDVLFVFVLVIQTVFSITAYFSSISSNYVLLFIINIVWLAYTYCMTFFYIPTRNRNTFSTLQFYFFLRYFAHIIISHKCLTGKVNITFKYPQFDKDWILIILNNKFIQCCPFVFEIQSILLWMSKKTKVSLFDFFIIRDVKQQIEIVMSKQINPNKEPKKKKRMLIGSIIFIISIVVIFGILYVLSSGSNSSTANPPLSAKLEIGVSSLNSLYTAQGIISSMNSNQHQAIADSGIESLHSLVLEEENSLSIIEFPLISHISWIPESIELKNAEKILRTSTDSKPFYKFTFYFNKPVGISSVQNVVYQYYYDPLTSKEGNNLADIILGNSTEELFNIILPLVLMVPDDDEIYDITNVRANTNRLYINNNNWMLNETTSGIPLNFLIDKDNYRILLWSKPVIPNSLLGISMSLSLLLYLIIIIVLGIIIRFITLGFMKSLWIERMKQPQKLYRMIIAIDAFRSANDFEKEYVVAENLLNTLRSQETCIEITNK